MLRLFAAAKPHPIQAPLSPDVRRLMLDSSAIEITIAIAISFAAGILVQKYGNWRRKSLLRKLEELDEQDDFIQKLGSGYKTLLRTSLNFILLSLCIFAFSATAISWFDHPYVRFIVGLLLIGISYMCGQHIISIIRSRDPESESERIRAKKEKISEKLEDA